MHWTCVRHCLVTLLLLALPGFSFAQPQFLLSVAKSGTGGGTVTSVPAGIDCGATCSASFDPATVVELRATPATGSYFAGWSGACVGFLACTVSMTEAKAVTVSFMVTRPLVPQYPLSVAKSGDGSGTVTSVPARIDCGATCSAYFYEATHVQLTATPASGSIFAGWSGLPCVGTGPCNVTLYGPTSVTAIFSVAANIPRVSGISTRMGVLTGDNVLIAGLVIGGSTSKTVVINARGPSLTSQGVSGALSNPTLTLVPASGAAHSTNNNWGEAPNAATIQSLGLAPPSSLESSILTTLAPGAYTAIVSGEANATGVGIVEVFEVDAAEVPITGFSTRGAVQPGDGAMIAGFIISGNGPQTVIVRARGPSMGIAGALANPTLTLVPASGSPITNDDWGTAPNAAAISSSGFAPADSREAAILAALDPGAYTAVVTGVGGTTGIAIVEVYRQ